MHHATRLAAAAALAALSLPAAAHWYLITPISSTPDVRASESQEFYACVLESNGTRSPPDSFASQAEAEQKCGEATAADALARLIEKHVTATQATTTSVARVTGSTETRAESEPGGVPADPSWVIGFDADVCKTVMPEPLALVANVQYASPPLTQCLHGRFVDQVGWAVDPDSSFAGWSVTPDGVLMMQSPRARTSGTVTVAVAVPTAPSSGISFAFDWRVP